MSSRRDALGWLFRDYRERSKTKIDYQSDKSLVSARQDKFKHSHYVEVLKDILSNSKTPINIGLYGRWGVGKSSILHMLKESLETKPLSDKFQYVEVDAWGLSAQSLQPDILVEINDQLKVYSSKELEDQLFNVHIKEDADIKIIFKKYWYFFVLAGSGTLFMLFYPGNETWDILTKLAGIGIFSVLAAVLSFIRFLAGSSQRIISRPASPFQFNQIYKKIVKNQKKTLVVVIDNLDRCDDKVAVDLLGTIQTFMAKENCINILACDDEAIVNHLKQVKGEVYIEREGNEFLSKFFQVTIRIPPFIGENLDTYAQELMNERSIPFDPFVKQILISGAIKNPRKINQFLNNVVALYRLAEFKEKDKKLPVGSITKRTDVLTKLIVLRHEWPDFYKELEKNPNVLNDKEWFNQWQTKYVAKIENSTSLEGLEDFLNGTQFCYVENISPFLRLNQESYEAEIPEIDKFELDVNGNRLAPVLEVFKKIEENKKELYVKKINSLMNKHADQGVIPSLLNCTFVMMGIINEIKDLSLKKIALANLGRHLSSQLLNALEKYDLEKLFSIAREMERNFSNPIYQTLLSLINRDKKLNQKLVRLFLENGNSIPSSIMNSLDESLAQLFESNQGEILELIKEVCSSSNWKLNNILKPSKLLSSFYSQIVFDDSDEDNEKLHIYQSIHENISQSEKGQFINRIAEVIQETENAEVHTLETKIFEVIDNFGILELEEVEHNLFILVDALIHSLTFNPDIEQKKQTLEILFKLVRGNQN